MIDQQTSIEPPPSLEAILTHRERIGRVDFTHRLAPEVPVAAEDAEAGTVEPGTVEPSAATVEPAPSVQDLTGADADAEGEAVDHDHDDDDRSYLDPPLTAVDEARLAAHPAMREREQPTVDAVDAVVTDPAAGRSSAVYPAAEPAQAHDLPRREASEPVAQLLSLVPAEDADTVVEDVEEIVEGVLARIREAQHATAAHLEATEIEAALRCEMLTAQAELDAELIRLHARREAHAIIAAARQRAGVPQPVHSEHQRRRLDQLGEAAMRLAEELAALDTDPVSPDHPFRR